MDFAMIRRRVSAALGGDSSGHDVPHCERVAALAVRLGAPEGANLAVVEAAALLHDVGDHKLAKAGDAPAAEQISAILAQAGATPVEIEQIVEICSSVSWSKGAVPVSIEGRVVQDADRLDAIGATGIARCFAFGGAFGRSLASSQSHFGEKLLLVRERMNTAAGRQEAEVRHERMVTFLAGLAAEWGE